MRILGLSALYHDSAAALIEDGVIRAAAQEERFTRKKHDAAFPENAINFCLKEAGIKADDIDWVVFYEKPFLKFDRLIETYLAMAPRGFASFAKSMPLWFGEKLFQKQLLAKRMKAMAPSVKWEDKLLFSGHHLSHAASAFFPSPYESAAVLTMDGVGEWTTTSVMMGSGNRLEPLKEIQFPHSIGLFYSAFTYYLGFKVNSGEYKVMGLAPYGEPKYTKIILDKMVDRKPDGSFWLNQEYFDYCTGLKMIQHRFEKLFGQPARREEQELTQFHMDIAASLQQATEELVLGLCEGIRRETGARNLCLGGGVALNCVANGKVWKTRRFDGIWIQPAAGDAGGAVGAALAAYHLQFNGPRKATGKDTMRGAFLGPSFPAPEADSRLRAAGAVVETCSGDSIIERCADALADGKALGWFQSRMEFGPRALGSRSVLADPRRVDMQSRLNLKIKYRESFRPFAPIVLREALEEWFDLDIDSPYMLMVAPVREDKRLALSTADKNLFGIDRLNKPRSKIPAVTHLDFSARIQTVSQETHPRLHALLKAFEKRTGCPILVNTSFNVRGEPIVCTPEDAYRCFMGTELDVLAVENSYLSKEAQPASALRDYKNAFDAD